VVSLHSNIVQILVVFCDVVFEVVVSVLLSVSHVSCLKVLVVTLVVEVVMVVVDVVVVVVLLVFGWTSLLVLLHLLILEPSSVVLLFVF